MITIKCFSVRAELEWGKKGLLVLFSHHSLPTKDVISSRWNQHKCTHLQNVFISVPLFINCGLFGCVNMESQNLS